MEDKNKDKEGKTSSTRSETYNRMLDRLAEESRLELSQKLGFDIPAEPQLEEELEKDTETGVMQPLEMPAMPIKPQQDGARVAAQAHEDDAAIPFYRRGMARILSLSAAAVLLCIVGCYCFFSWEGEVRRQASAGMVAMCEGDSAFTLSDGSEITLQASARLTVSESFGKKDRVVSLAGMGYMHAATDSTRPYTVNMPHGLSLTVRGTAFNINAYGENKLAEITVTDGCVAICNKDKGVSYGEFRKGDRFIYDASTGKAFRQTKVNLDEATAWMKGERIVLQHATVEQFKQMVFRRYGKEVVIMNNAIPHDADIMWESRGRHPDVEEVADGVGFLYGCKCRIEGNRVYILPQS